MGLGKYEDFSEKYPPIHMLFNSLIGFQRVTGNKGRGERSAEALTCHETMESGQSGAEKLDLEAERNVLILVKYRSPHFAERC